MASYAKHRPTYLLLLLLISFLVVIPEVSCGHSHGGEGECVHEDEERDSSTARKLKVVALVSILVGSVLGISIPILAKRFHLTRADSIVFFPIKAFAAGVILATGFIHMLPEGSEKLSSPCLKENPWHKFPFGGFIAMLAAVATFMLETIAASYYRRRANPTETEPVVRHPDEEEAKVAVPGHGHGHGHGMAMALDGETLRHRVVSQVLELGIVAHSVIIGMAVGTSKSPSTIRTLIAALTFHQFFEGMGLGGSLVQAKFKAKTIVVMAIFFSLTTPLGVAIGIGITKSYDENSRTALIIEGVLHSASAGILIYAALVDLLAPDFTNPKLQTSGRLQFVSYVALLVGLGAMSLIGKWA